jgi:hypothetical protein
VSGFSFVCELRFEEPPGFRLDEARAVEVDVSGFELEGEVKKRASKDALAVRARVLLINPKGDAALKKPGAGKVETKPPRGKS